MAKFQFLSVCRKKGASGKQSREPTLLTAHSGMPKPTKYSANSLFYINAPAQRLQSKRQEGAEMEKMNPSLGRGWDGIPREVVDPPPGMSKARLEQFGMVGDLGMGFKVLPQPKPSQDFKPSLDTETLAPNAQLKGFFNRIASDKQNKSPKHSSR